MMDFKESYYYYVIKMLLTVLHTKIGHINIWLYYVCVSFRIFHSLLCGSGRKDREVGRL